MQNDRPVYDALTLKRKTVHLFVQYLPPAIADDFVNALDGLTLAYEDAMGATARSVEALRCMERLVDRIMDNAVVEAARLQREKELAEGVAGAT